MTFGICSCLANLLDACWVASKILPKNDMVPGESGTAGLLTRLLLQVLLPIIYRVLCPEVAAKHAWTDWTPPQTGEATLQNHCGGTCMLFMMSGTCHLSALPCTLRGVNTLRFLQAAKNTTCSCLWAQHACDTVEMAHCIGWQGGVLGSLISS